MTPRTAANRFLPHVAAAVAGFVIAYLLIAFFVFPSGAGDTATIPNVVGSSFTDAVRDLEQRGFIAEQGEKRVQGTASPGTVVEQSPTGGSRRPKGTRVTLHVSAGERSRPSPGGAP